MEIKDTIEAVKTILGKDVEGKCTLAVALIKAIIEDEDVLEMTGYLPEMERIVGEDPEDGELHEWITIDGEAIDLTAQQYDERPDFTEEIQDFIYYKEQNFDELLAEAKSILGL